MALITPANMKLLTDHLAGCYEAMAGLGSKDGGAVDGTSRGYLADALTMVVTDLDDYEQQTDLASTLYSCAAKIPYQTVAAATLKTLVSMLDSHCKNRGSSVAASIKSLATFLSYYNGGSGAARFANMLVPSFQLFYFALKAGYLPMAGVLSPAINPANGAADGMGVRAVGGSFTDGAAIDTTKYSEVNLIAVVTTTFVSGTGAPTLTVAGTDHTGATINWTGTFGSNNPAATLSTTTSEPIVAYTRQVVTLASATGIVVGSWVKIDEGTEDEETVLVEAVSTNDVTVVCKKAHLSGAAVTGNTTLALTPATGGRRCANVTGITIGITAHTAGAVRIEGVQDRVAL